MKLVRSLSMFLALAAASSTAYAEKAAPPKAPEKAADKAPAKPAEKPAAKEEMSPAEIAKVERFFNDLVDAMVKNQDSCPKMATAINGVFDKHAKFLEQATASGKDVPQATKDKMAKRQGEMIGAVMKCKDDAGVNAAMARFAALGQKKADAKK